MKLFHLLASKSRLLLLGASALFALSAHGGSYTIQIGQGTAPFVDDPPTTSYTVDPTGIQNQQGVHGFVTHHNGVDTYVNMPGENYYITFLHVNNLGNVSGTYNANYAGYGCNSFFWSGGQPVVFSPNGVWSDAHVTDMNNLGQVVGHFGFNGTRQGFIYDHGNYTTFDLTMQLQLHTFTYNGQTYRMNGESTIISAINDYGQITGNFGLYSGGSFWYIASPVGMIPEPSTLTLFGLGALALIKLRRKSS